MLKIVQSNSQFFIHFSFIFTPKRLENVWKIKVVRYPKGNVCESAIFLKKREGECLDRGTGSETLI